MQQKACTTKESRDCGLMCSLLLPCHLTVFLVLERSGALDVSNELHLACLHYVFLPRINQHLEKFCEGWNNHPLSTEKNMSPNQLWIHGLHRIVGSGSTIDKELWEPQNDMS